MEKIGRDWVMEKELIISEDNNEDKENGKLNVEFKEEEMERVLKIVRDKSKHQGWIEQIIE